MQINEITIYLEFRVCRALGIEYNESGAESSHGKDEIIKAIEDHSRSPVEEVMKARILRTLPGKNVTITNKSSGHFKVLKA